jgi:hypothetical protein
MKKESLKSVTTGMTGPCDSPKLIQLCTTYAAAHQFGN